MLGEEAVYFTIMRNPVEALISLFDKHITKNMPLENILHKAMRGENDPVRRYFITLRRHIISYCTTMKVS